MRQIIQKYRCHLLQQQKHYQQQQLFLNRAQNTNITTTHTAMDVAKHIHLTRQALQFGNANVILQQLNLAEMKLSLIVLKNNASSSLDKGGGNTVILMVILIVN